MAVQKRNDELVDILRPDFVEKGNPSGYWHGHRMTVPTGVALVIPADHAIVVPRFEVTGTGSLEISGSGALLVI